MMKSDLDKTSKKRIEAPAVNLDHDCLLRVKQILTIIPISKAGWWAGVREGRFPQPIKLGERTTCWKSADILRLVTGGE